MKHLTLSLLTIALVSAPAFAASSDYSAAVLTDNPYLFYRFGESSGDVATDTTGNAHDGSYVNGPALGAAGAGAGSDTAVAFTSASSQHVSSPMSTFGSLLDGMSLEFVLRTTTAAQQSLFGAYNTGSTTALEVTLNDNNIGSSGTLASGVRLYLRDDSGLQIRTHFVNASLFDGNFHHLVYTYDSAIGVAAYLDGVAQTMVSANTGTAVTFSDFGFTPVFAARNVRGTLSQYADVTLDEVALYDGALSELQVGAHATFIPEPGSASLMALAGIALLARRRRS